MGIKLIETKKKVKPKNGFQLEELLTREITLFGSSFNNKKKAQWYDELSVLLTSGIHLKNALELLSETQKKEKDGQMMQQMLDRLVTGTSFSEIIQDHKSFTDYEFYAIKIGEQTGQLARVAKELSGFYKRKDDRRREITSALTYPVIVLMTAIIVVIFMLKYVVPMFVDIFKQNNVTLPAVTKAIISFSEFISENGGLVLLMTLLLIIGFIYISKKDFFKKISGNLQLKLPILGDYIRNIYLAQFTQALALLTASKVSITESMELVSKMISFNPLQVALKDSMQQVVAGGKLSSAFAKHKVFDKKMIALIRVAEETNQTEYIFEKLSQQYNHQVQYQSQIIANVLNPILTIFVGVIVGVILIAMYLPMFRLSSVIG